MKKMLWIVGLATSLLTSCNYDEGACWSRAEEDGQVGAGGGPIVPGGGGYGDTAPKPQDANDPLPPECASVMEYSPTLFKFTTVVADDGQGKGGGWQEATATLQFVDGRQSPADAWSCTITVGMAIRSSTIGVISPARAASMTASVLTYASSATMHSRPKWIQALFCGKLKTNMNAMFGESYGGAGAEVR